MILITGATGNLGTSIVNQLLKSLSKNEFIVTSSNDSGVELLKAKGLNARKADFSNPDSLAKAFAGVSKLVLISTMDPKRLEQHKNVIDQAVKANVQHIIYTGLAIQNIQTSAVKELMSSHFETETYLKKSGLTYTILRNTMYADALTQILGPNALNQNIHLPGGNGKVPYVLRREMGEATANLVLQERHENKTYNFTGGIAYSYEELANALSELTGEKIEYIDIEEQQFKESLQQIGFPDFLIYLHAGTIADIKQYQYEIQDDTLEKLLGRPSANLTTFLKELFQL